MFKKILGVGGSISVIAFLAAFFTATPTYAAGENYSWHNYSQITAVGGAYTEAVSGAMFVFTQREDNPAVFESAPNIDECMGKLTLTLSSRSRGNITGTDCPLVSNVSQNVTIQSVSSVNVRANSDSQYMREAYVKKACREDQTPEGIPTESCREAAEQRHTSVASTCLLQHNFTDSPHLANAYLDCIAETLEVDRPATNEGDEEGSSTDRTQCAIPEIGWMVCQALSFLSWITDLAFGLLTMFLTVEPLKQYVDVETAAGISQEDSPLYSAWKVALGFANVVFVFIFILMIFSYITNQGLSNYSIKKIGPRLIIASLLVNLSFFICGVAVDLSNILGQTLRSTLVDMAQPSTGSTSYNSWSELTESIIRITPVDENYNTANNPQEEEDPDADPPPADPNAPDPLLTPEETRAIFGGVPLVGGAVLFANLSVLVPFMLAALAALITVLILLIIRQAVIICLIMISPLAFALILLPNTKQWFDRWADIFTKFLVLYPAISLVFGASYLASTVVSVQASQNSQSFLAMFALGIQLIPLFVAPLILKLSGGLLDRFAGVVNNPNKGPLDRMRKVGREFREDRKQLRMGRHAKTGDYKRDPSKGRLKNGVGRAKHFARNPSGAINRFRMTGEAADTATSGMLDKSTSREFGTKDDILTAAKGIKDGEFRDSLIEESLAYAAKELSDVEVDRVKANVIQMEEEGISGKDAREMVHSGKDRRGNPLSDIEYAAAMQMAANTATDKEAHELIAESGQKSDLVRRTLADTLRKNGFSKRNAHFGGAALNRVAEGGFNRPEDIDNLMVDAAAGNKYGASTLANQSEYTIQRLGGLMQDGAIQGQRAANLKRSAELSLSNPTTNANIRPGAREHIERMSK